MSLLMSEAHRLLPRSEALKDLVAAHLGTDPAEVEAVGRPVPVVERPNLQLAFDSVIAEQPAGRVIGLSPELAHYGGFSLSALLSGRFPGPSDPVPPVYDDVAIDVDTTLRCVTAGLWLVEHGDQPVVIALAPGERHGPSMAQDGRLEVFSPLVDTSNAVLDELDKRRHQFNVYRGKMLAFTFSEYGEFGITFMPRPSVTADEVVLPPEDLASIERHAIGMAERADELRSANRELKRGLLLYGPPGSGKTHTVAYLAAAMPERTVVVLQGPSVGALGQAAAIVRSLSPAMLVIEDVDLIATTRGMPGMDTNPLLFQLLNEMDGLTPTDDVLFVLTTNRLDIVEPALAARPGRIDHALEIDLPDAVGRWRLLDLYLRDCPHEIDDPAPIIERIDGVTASFVKELVRRALLLALDDDATAVADRHLRAAADELLDSARAVTRTILGAGSADDRAPMMPGRPMMPPGLAPGFETEDH